MTGWVFELGFAPAQQDRVPALTVEANATLRLFPCWLSVSELWAVSCLGVVRSINVIRPRNFLELNPITEKRQTHCPNLVVRFHSANPFGWLEMPAQRLGPDLRPCSAA